MGPTPLDIVVGLLPLLLVLGVGFLFLRQLQKQAKALERIAAVLEKRQ